MTPNKELPVHFKKSVCAHPHMKGIMVERVPGPAVNVLLMNNAGGSFDTGKYWRNQSCSESDSQTQGRQRKLLQVLSQTTDVLQLWE